ncbi:MAG: phosphoribosylformylglycinamidine synthase subunit PurQ [Acidobacteria bacterium]|nr:MAG: phosphoribosylformylglycinamidine synthase subunit PurQ [Acidobacteriota bacterium]REK12155.1 MAG: phosphoribosylformylglycinamidine synthase subunit PurQ [Acidobacteriota bacterium]
MNCGVVVFPGSNCDHDVYHVLAHVLQQPTRFLWHDDDGLQGSDLVVVPGGFSYGDYLRAGAMAASSPVLAAVRRHAEGGGLVLGICNGFQILLEAGLLPGAMRRNAGLRFLSQDVNLRVERDDLPFTRAYSRGQVLRMPIAHAEGNYVDREPALDRLEAERQVVFRYCDADGSVGGRRAAESNPNGSERAIAGICSASGNVCALMPHPERAAEEVLGNTDGLAMFAGLVGAVAEGIAS